MKTRININSVEAYNIVNLGERQKEVYSVIKAIGSITAKGIAFHMKVPINQVTGRITELMEKQLIKISCVGIDKLGTKRKVNYYRIRKDYENFNTFSESWEDKYNELNEYMKEVHPGILKEFNYLCRHEL